MNKKLSFALLVMILVPGLLCAQPEEDLNLEQFVEQLFQVQDTDIDYEDLYESLYLLYTNPLNLNKATTEDLASLYILNAQQITALQQYIQENGELLSMYELQAVEGFDVETISNIEPFVTVEEADLAADTRPLLERILSERNNYFIYRYEQILEQQRGFTEPTINASGEPSSRYAGSQGKYMGRFRVSHRNDFSLGFTFEKDAGERFGFADSTRTYGFDFSSFHFMLQNKGKLKALAIGDYQVQAGQGLVFGAGFNPGKGAETITTVRRGTTGIRPYSSVLETGFFRGVGATYELNNFQVSGYFSRLWQDAGIRNDTTFTDFEEYISSIQLSGFHRTDSELEAKNSVLEHSYGGTVDFSTDRRKYLVGASVLHTNYSLPLQRRPNNYNQFEFSGTSNTVVGAYGSYLWQNFNIFGEVARSTSGGIGAVGGFMASLSRYVDMSMVLRRYDKDFHTFYGNAFGEGSRNINESGIYWGLKIKPSRKYFLTAYFDKFNFPWLRFRVDAPSDGYEYLARFNYRPQRDILIYAQIREEVKDITTSPEGATLSRTSAGVKRNYIFNFDYRVNEFFDLKSRVQYSNYTLADEYTEGVAFVQDFNVEYGRFRLSSRFALFDTDDYENRQYVYERDVLYAFSIPAYNGLGIRNYLLLQYKPSRKFNVWIRYARFNFRNVDEIGSGLNAIEGNTRTDIKVQVRVRF